MGLLGVSADCCGPDTAREVHARGVALLSHLKVLAGKAFLVAVGTYWRAEVAFDMPSFAMALRRRLARSLERSGKEQLTQPLRDL